MLDKGLGIWSAALASSPCAARGSRTTPHSCVAPATRNDTQSRKHTLNSSPMCGIVGYVGPRVATPLLVEGLKRLEYRGYDSAGVAVMNGKGVETVKAAGKIVKLEQGLAASPLHGTIGIAHTRWATHGPPTTGNAHPHVDCKGEIAVVHNGIIENAGALRHKLEQAGHKFTSDTDTEVLAHLVEEYL